MYLLKPIILFCSYFIKPYTFLFLLFCSYLSLPFLFFSISLSLYISFLFLALFCLLIDEIFQIFWKKLFGCLVNHYLLSRKGVNVIELKKICLTFFNVFDGNLAKKDILQGGSFSYLPLIMQSTPCSYDQPGASRKIHIEIKVTPKYSEGFFVIFSVMSYKKLFYDWLRKISCLQKTSNVCISNDNYLQRNEQC